MPDAGRGTIGKLPPALWTTWQDSIETRRELGQTAEPLAVAVIGITLEIASDHMIMGGPGVRVVRHSG